MSIHSACALLLAALLAGCGQKTSIEILSAEFQDENPDGRALEDETIRVTLSQPLPDGLALERLLVVTRPPAAARLKVEPGDDRSTLVIRIQTGTPAFRLDGIHGIDPAATGIGIDLGDGVRWIDLQPPRSLPVLERVIWEDSSSDVGNLIVDQGDSLRLLFDRPVELSSGSEDADAVTPRDVILAKPNDRLDDGAARSRFEAGGDDHEVRIVLGSNPILTIGGALAAVPAAIERFGHDAPSGLALNGTTVIPLPKVRDRRGGPGAVSRRELDIEFPVGFPLPIERREVFPEPGTRMFHTLTPFEDGRAVIAGGETVEHRQTIDQVLVYDPLFERHRTEPFTTIGTLPHPVKGHTATLLGGRDGELGTADDVVLIAGGTDDTDTFGDLTLTRRREGKGFEVLPLEERLLFPRSRHAAVAVSPNEVLIDGGIGTEGLIEAAELISFELEDDAVRVSKHAAFRTLARMNHTLTLLPRADDGAELVLAYGGYGRDRARTPVVEKAHPFGAGVDPAASAEVFFPTHSGVVLFTPILVNVRRPSDSIALTGFPFSLSLLRHSHLAVPLHPDPLAPSRAAAAGAGSPAMAAVAIAGGTSSHVVQGFEGSWKLYEMHDDLTVPQGSETADVVVFRFDPQSPQASRLEVVEHPALHHPGEAPERTHLAAVAVPGYGVVLAGGEQSGDRDGRSRLQSADVFLPDANRLARLVIPLATPRARHQAYLVEHDGVRSLFLLGGVSRKTTPRASVVEEIPLRD
jgi:hypothetical protein